MSETTTISETNAATMREFNRAIFDDHDLDAVEEYLSPDVVHYQAGMEVARGYDGSREYFGAVLSAFPDIDLDVREIVADDEYVMFRFEAAGTHEGPLPVIGEDGERDVVEPTGKSVSWQGMVSGRFEDGLVVEANLISDQYGMAKQLGLIPADN